MQDSPARVSIGLPVRNGERYIRQTLDSLLAQSFTDFDLIISDNASTDSTRDICLEYVTRDPRISYHRNAHNVGPAENYTRCFRLARGEYFKWAAHDDLCLPQYLEKCVAVLDAEPDVVNCHSRTRVIDENGEVVRDYDFRTSTADPKPHLRFGRLINVSHRFHVGYEIFGVMRRAVMQQIPPQGAYAHADRVFLVRMSLRGRFVEIPEYLFLARQHSEQSMANRLNGDLRAKLSRLIGPGPLPPPEWWDASLKNRVVFPDWRLLREYHASVSKAPLRPLERLRCEMYVGLWVVKYWPKLARDLIFASDRVLRRNAEPQNAMKSHAADEEYAADHPA